MKFKNILLSTLVVAGLFTSCSDEWLEESPTNALNADGAITSVQAADLALNGAYSRMQDGDYYGGSFLLNSDVKGDDVQCFMEGRRFADEYNYTTTADFGSVNLYKEAYIVNSQAVLVLAAIGDITDGTEAQINNVKGEALALSALAHFDLVRTYGKTYTMDNGVGLGVPIISQPADYTVPVVRNTVAEVYNYVITSLETAKDLLSEEKTPGRINSWAAKALLSRVYLYKGDNVNALKLAEEVMSSSKYGLIDREGYVESWSSEFNAESLFEIINLSDDNGADRESIGYVAKPQPDGYGAVAATDAFIARITADPADVRGQFIQSHEGERNGYIAKYPGTGGENYMINNVKVLRMSEVYLNAAEAAFKIGDAAHLAKSLTYLNAIYKRATDKEIVSSDLTLERILIERRNELVLEGHRLFDAMRNNETMDRTGGNHFTIGEAKSVNRNWNKTVMPLPQYELDTNKSLVQNPGYN